MTPYELFILGMEPFLPCLHNQVRARVLDITRASAGRRLQVLDVGGRNSRYTIGIPADITITDLPRQTEMQHALHLGLTEQIMKRHKARRTNVRAVELDDMTQTRLPAASFDCVIAIEVLEHVEQDDAFVHNVASVLKPGGTFIMTTPNGDWKPIPSGDHKRHYRRAQLQHVLERAFDRVEIRYAVAAGLARDLGLRALNPRRPLRSLLSMGGNAINAALSARPAIRERAERTHHLIAVATKA